ncbi:hypothetical protein [Vulcanisaeta sp. JCM 16159]|nr:hypothetical protein [Vulcanisaeta sp. JCM 16159]
MVILNMAMMALILVIFMSIGIIVNKPIMEISGSNYEINYYKLPIRGQPY